MILYYFLPKLALIYIHTNPVHHEFVAHPVEYPWSSYQSCISTKPTKLKRNEVVDWFDDSNNFKVVHKSKIDFINLEKWLEL